MSKKAILTLMLAVSPLFASAASLHFGDYFLKGSEKGADDIYVVGNSATFAGSVSGDAIALSKRIFSGGDITNDAFFIGEEVNLEGDVQDDARIIGGTVTVKGVVHDDLVVIGSKVIIAPETRIEGSLYVIGEDVRLGGTVLGDVKMFVGTLRQTGIVEGDMEVWGEALFTEPASIGGDFIYHTDNASASPVNVVVTGDIIIAAGKHTDSFFPDVFRSGFFSLRILMMLAVGFLLFFLARERTEEVLTETLPRFWFRALRGLLVIVLLPALTVLLLPTVVGIPIAAMLGALFILLLLLSWAGAGILLGVWIERLVFKRPPFPLSYRAVLVGILALSLITLIPFVGWLFHAILLVAAAGSIGTVFYRHLRQVR